MIFPLRPHFRNSLTAFFGTSALLALAACSGKSSDGPSPTDDSAAPATDADGDGYQDQAGGGDDCDDTDQNTNPGADDIPYDGKDQDCSGADLTDVDGDGHDGEPAGGDDCNDSNPEVNPDAAEICYDNLDNNCDGIGAADDTAAMDDCDGDGADRMDDCDDEDPAVYPGAPDAWYDGVDSDCGFDSDYDQDLDGEDTVDGGGTDCDDLDPLVNTAADERWNDVDDDCDGGVDQLSTSNANAGWHGEYADLDTYLGYDWALTEDLDADGLDDVAIGSPGTGESVSGAVYVMSTASSAAPSVGALATITGSTTYLGLSVTRLDSGDLAVGGYGALYLYGPGQLSGAVPADSATAILTSDPAGYTGAWSDGLATIGGPLSASSGVMVWDGATVAAGGAIPASAASFSLTDGNASVGGGLPGDLDGDGLDELVYSVSVLSISAKVAVVPGDVVAAGGAVSGDEAVGLTGVPLVDGSDGSVRIAGGNDYDGDGYRELIVGVLGADGAADGSGVVDLVDGDQWAVGGALTDLAETRIEGQAAGGQLAPAATSGDVDGDGLDDLVLGFPGSGAAGVTSEVWFVTRDVLAGHGTITPAAGTPNFRSGSLDDRFGFRIQLADPDHDGDDDLFVSALASYGSLDWFERL